MARERADPGNRRISEGQSLTGSGDRKRDTLERRVVKSRNSHRAAHHQLAGRQKTLDEHFNRVLKHLMLTETRGRVQIDMRGIRPVMDENDSTPGEALTSETALALDLACLSASIAGLGHFPRFLIHDSPREGDLEPHIYARMFTFIRRLEELFERRDPSFQYIIATTTPPPASLAKEPYVRLTLDARSGDGLLLRRRF